MSNVQTVRSALATPTFDPGTLPIWHPEDGEYYNGRRNGVYLFRRGFEVEAKSAHLAFRIFADTRYRFYLDGVLLGWGPSRTDHRLAQFDTYSFECAVGVHVLAVIAMHYGYSTGANTSVHQMLIGELRDGLTGEALFGTDERWRTEPAHWLARTCVRASGTLGPMEICDTRVMVDEWAEPGFDDSGWAQAVAMYGSTESLPWYAFEPRDIAMPKWWIAGAAGVSALGRAEGGFCEDRDLGKTLLPVSWSETNQQAFPLALDGSDKCAAVANIDWPEPVCGFLQLEILIEEADAGSVIDVFYAEMFDGRDVASFGSSLRRVADRFELRAGVNRLEVVFGWKAFRHVQVWAWGRVKILAASARAMGYPLPPDPPMAVANDAANLLIANCYRTLRLCAQDGLLDSPSREQQQWMGDGERQASMLFTLYGETDLWRRLLKQIGQSIDWAGCLLPRYPGRHEHTAPIPSFMLSWIFSHAEYSRRVGDRELVAEWWPQLNAVMRWFGRFENADGLLEDVPYWSFLDWGEAPDGPGLDVARRGVVTGLNALYIGARKAMATLAAEKGDAAAGEQFLAGNGGRVHALSRASFDEVRGAFVDCVVRGGRSETVSEATNLLVLEHLGADWGGPANVIQDVFLQPRGPVVKMSPFFFLSFGRVLAAAGRTREAYDILLERQRPALESGAQTTWERCSLFHEKKDGQRYVGSASHAWGATMPVFLIESVLRAEPVDFTRRSFVVDPDLSVVSEGEVSFATAGGIAVVRWNGARVEWEVPDGVCLRLK